MTTEQESLNCEGPYICGFFSINTMVLWDPRWWIFRCRTAYTENLWELGILGLWNSRRAWNQCLRKHSDHCIFNLCCVFLVTQLCLTLCDPMDCSPPGSSVHGDSSGKNTGEGCHALLQGNFPTQGSNPGLRLI